MAAWKKLAVAVLQTWVFRVALGSGTNLAFSGQVVVEQHLGLEAGDHDGDRVSFMKENGWEKTTDILDKHMHRSLTVQDDAARNEMLFIAWANAEQNLAIDPPQSENKSGA